MTESRVAPREPMVALDKKILAALNEHICAELAASHRYLAASAYFREQSLDGMAHWMRVQADEEHAHAMKFYEHILERDGHIELAEIPKPPAKYKSPVDAFEKALEDEKRTSAHIDKLYADAVSRKDYALQIFLQWFIQEQVQEEDAARRIVDRLKLIGNDKAGLVIVDQELGGRTQG